MGRFMQDRESPVKTKKLGVLSKERERERERERITKDFGNPEKA